MLEELKIDFEAEYNPEWIKPRLYDFYFELNDKEYILEMDGGFHNNDNKMNGQSKEESQFIDNEKDRLAKEHNIKVIRIDCNYESVETRFNYIRNSVLNDKNLNKLFDLSNINFNKCNEFACSNLVKTACEYKRNNPDIKTTEISNILKKAVSTIIRWLKIGNELGWCYYNAREELLKVVPLNGKSTGKQVEIFKDHISLGIFESCHELERCSEELFRVKLNVNGISRVCRGERKSHKGYTFKYI
jgi:hypothetical protein